ncbi:MAG: ACP S-malonyltransferase [Pseudomonadota bacterium]|nr:ACP S-malonyltransferase [Pseudomonadota bacterium]
MNVAIVFPGQGSQSVGMLGKLADAHEVVARTFEEVSDYLGEDFGALVREGPAEVLNRTENTQPAMLAAGVAVWRVWQSQGGCEAIVAAGHSFGEITALVAAGALDFETASGLARTRGRLMQDAVAAGKGAMAAILGLDDEQVIALCDEVADGQVLSAVNFNAPGQVVVAGEAEAVERLTVAAKAAGARRALKLAVSVPAHSALMKPAADEFARALASVTIRAPRIPVLHNVDVTAREDADSIREALALQLYSPVKWVETIQAMRGRGADIVLELGPGKVLAGLNKRIDRSTQAICVQDPSSLEQALQACTGVG